MEGILTMQLDERTNPAFDHVVRAPELQRGCAAPTKDELRMRETTNSQSNHKRSDRILHNSTGRELVRIVPDECTPLWRIEWPDQGLSDVVNLSRAKDAALAWAQWRAVREHRKNSGARSLKSLNKFSWSSSPMRQNNRGASSKGHPLNRMYGLA